MRQEIVFTSDDSIAIIAPHPDDECLGAAAALLMAPDRTDVYVLTDGSHGSPDRSIREEAAIRKKQFEAEMTVARPRSWRWLGYEDTKLLENIKAASEIDFTKYTKVFLPWSESLHPDHRAAAKMCQAEIYKQKSRAECYTYEICAPFHDPTHYIDITDVMDRKRELIRCHADQAGQEEIVTALNRLRAAQMTKHPQYRYVEAYQKVNTEAQRGYSDILIKLYGYNDDPAIYKRIEDQGVRIKRVMPMNITPVYEFIKDRFARAWADESLPALINGDCFVAVRGKDLLGFHVIEAPAKGFVGPLGVVPEARRMGIGQALVLAAVKAMREKGYRYAIGGMSHPWGHASVEGVASSMLIPDSGGSYEDML